MNTNAQPKKKSFAKKLCSASYNTARFTCSTAIGYGVVIASGIALGTLAGVVVKNASTE